MEEKKLVSVTVPEEFQDLKGCGLITAGKTYEVFNYDGNSSFHIIDDISKEPLSFCLKEKCAHIDNLDWILNYE